MKKSFEELFEDIKNSPSPGLDKIYEKAKKERKVINTILIIINIFFFVILIIFSSSIFSFLFMLIPILMMDVIFYSIALAFFSKYGKMYKNAFKNSVIKKILYNFYDNVTYMPFTSMPKYIYDEVKYNEYYNRYYSDDYMEGKIDKQYFTKMAEVHTIDEETTTDSDGNTTTTHTTRFHGIFAKINLEKSINANFSIRRNHSFFGGKRLDMDSQEFEKIFDVSCSNKIIGMHLTHDIMELLVSFKNTTGIFFDISIYNNILYLRFHTGAVFELKSLKKGAFDEDMLRKYYNIIDFTYTLSKMLIDLIDKTEI